MNAMKRGDVLRTERLKHLEALRALGVNPYPTTTKRTTTVAKALTETDRQVIVAGRVLAIRSHGKAMFLDVTDETGTIQIYAKADELGERFQELQLLDTGDFLEVSGQVFNTQLGQTTIHTVDFAILAKTLQPLPDQWQGLKDPEERYRKRYLDLLLNPEIRQLFDLRVKLIQATRQFMDTQGFT